jgi:hypothetical protein
MAFVLEFFRCFDRFNSFDSSQENISELIFPKTKMPEGFDIIDTGQALCQQT